LVREAMAGNFNPSRLGAASVPADAGAGNGSRGRSPYRNDLSLSGESIVLVSALGGWLGGLLAMLVFRHKTAKRCFQLKYAASFLVWGGLVGTWLAHC